ncbi:MAG: GxxExxY protein [Desulfuromonadaceae bacterium]
MNSDEIRENLDKITEVIIGCAYTVMSVLGSGFLEKVYENALVHEIVKSGLMALQQHSIKVHYDGIEIGDFVADLLVENQVLVELKAVKAIDDIHRAQCMNYLKATGHSVCLLINFGSPKLEVKRIVNNF